MKCLCVSNFAPSSKAALRLRPASRAVFAARLRRRSARRRRSLALDLRRAAAIRRVKLQTARSRLYRQLRSRAKTHFSAFFEIYKICILFHRSNLNICRFCNFFFVNFRISPDFCKNVKIEKKAKFQEKSATF